MRDVSHPDAPVAAHDRHAWRMGRLPSLTFVMILAAQIAAPARAEPPPPGAANRAKAAEKPDGDAVVIRVRPRMTMPNQHPIFGVRFEEVAEDQQPEGLKISAVDPGSPAELVGLQKDDILLRIDNQIVCDAAQVAALMEMNRGKSVKLRVLRDGKQRVCPVQIQPRGDNEDLRTSEKNGPPDAPRVDKGRRVGLDGTRVVDVRERVPGLPRGTGVRIQRAATLSHLEAGDIVSRFGDQIVCTAGQLEKLMRIHSADTVTIRFIRDGWPGVKTRTCRIATITACRSRTPSPSVTRKRPSRTSANP